jgi:hypothetical protein
VAGYNELHYLPGSIKRLRLDLLDLAPNSFVSMINMTNSNTLGVLSLLECAARKVIKCRSVLNALAIDVMHCRVSEHVTSQVSIPCVLSLYSYNHLPFS